MLLVAEMAERRCNTKILKQKLLEMQRLTRTNKDNVTYRIDS